MTQGTIRRLAAGAALAAAALYLLVGLQVVTVSTDVTATSDILGFGAVTAVIYAGLALLLMRSGSRRILIAAAIVQIVTLVGYVAVSSVRTPPFEPVGLTIKALQILVLLAVAYLALARRAPRAATS